MIIAEGRGVSVIFVCKKKENCLLRRSPTTTTTSVPSIDLSSYYVMLLLGEPKEFDIVREWASPSAGGRSRTTVKNAPKMFILFFYIDSSYAFLYLLLFIIIFLFSSIDDDDHRFMYRACFIFFLRINTQQGFLSSFFIYIYIIHTHTHTQNEQCLINIFYNKTKTNFFIFLLIEQQNKSNMKTINKQ